MPSTTILFCSRGAPSAFDAVLLSLAATVTANPKTLRWLLRRSRAVAGLLPPARPRIPVVG